jgi:pilus assembly protein CpaB
MQGNTRNFTTLLALAGALLLAAGGTWLANNHIEKKVAERTRHLQELYDGQLTTVVVPNAPLTRGQRIEKQFLSTRPVPTAWVQSGAITANDYQEALHRVLEFDVDQGKPLLWAHLQGQRMPTFSGRVDDGKRALTIPVDTISSFSGFLEPEDRIDLILTYKEGNLERSRPLMQNVRVLASGTRVETDPVGGEGTHSISTVTLLVDPEDAKRIIHSQTVGKLTATLRHPKDALPIADRGITASDLFKAPAPVKSQGPGRPRIEYIIGGSGGSS